MTHKHIKWLQILAQEDFPPKLLWSENADFKFSVNKEGSRGRKEETVEPRRQQETEEQEIGNRGIMSVLHCRKPRFLTVGV